MRTLDDIRRENPDVDLRVAHIGGMEIITAVDEATGLKVQTSAGRAWLYDSCGSVERGVVILADRAVETLRKSVAVSDSLDTIAETLQGALNGENQY